MNKLQRSIRETYAADLIRFIFGLNEYEVVEWSDSKLEQDLVFRKVSKDALNSQLAFCVDVKWFETKDAVKKLRSVLAGRPKHQVIENQHLPCYAAYVIGKGEELVVSASLIDKLSYDSEAVSIISLESILGDCSPG